MEIINNKKAFRFEALMENGEYAVVEYRWLKGNMVIMHTVVPAEYRKQGIGAAIMKYVLDYLREQHLKTVIYCPFAEKYVKEHPEYNDLVVRLPGR